MKLRKKELDSLLVTQLSRGVLEYTDTMFFSTNNPIIKVDTTKIDFKVSDSIKVPYTPFISQKENKIGFLFSKKLKSNYKLNLYPNALTDIFNISHDTIKAVFRTRKLEDYGDITLAIENPGSNQVIVELINKDDETETKQIINTSKTISFKYLTPKKYRIRIIYDANKNGKWDTGNYLKKIQPEIVEYFPTVQEVRPNWSLNEIITIKQ